MTANYTITVKSSAIMKSILVQRYVLEAYLSYICVVTTLVDVQCHDSKACAWLYLHCSIVLHSTAQRSAAQHSTAQHSTAQRSTAQHSTANTIQHNMVSSYIVTVQYLGMTQVGKLLGNPLRGRRGHPSVGAGQLWVHSCNLIRCGLVGTNCVEWGKTKLRPLLTAIVCPVRKLSAVSRYILNSEHIAYTGGKRGMHHVLIQTNLSTLLVLLGSINAESCTGPKHMCVPLIIN